MAGQAAHEWILGRLPFPGAIADTPDAEVVVLLESTRGLIVAQRLTGAREVRSTAVALVRESLSKASAAARPSRMRAADAAIADAVRSASLGLAVVVAPTPELEEVRASMQKYFAQAAATPDLPEGDHAAMGKLFRAAATLWVAAPWKAMFDSDLLRVDAPELGVEGACLTVLGNAGQHFGFLLFPSASGFESFCEVSERLMDKARARGRVDLGTTFLSLEFERGAELLPDFRRLVEARRWPVAAAHAYPVAHLHARDGAASTPSARDLTLLTRVSSALAAFVARHGDAFADEGFAASETFTEGDDAQPLRLTFPFEPFHAFDRAPADVRLAGDLVQAAPKVGRNDPCPCGSGKKYKKCHLEEDAARGREAHQPPPGGTHELVDAQLILLISRYAEARFGAPWVRLRDSFVRAMHEDDVQLLLPWLTFDARIEGRRIGEWFREECEGALTKAQQDWLDAQLAAWLSIWRVRSVDGRATLVVEDLLTGERRTLDEPRAAATMQVGDALLGRVVGFDGRTLLWGSHPHLLLDDGGDEAVARARKRLRRTTNMSVERLRSANIDPFLLRMWNELVDE